MKWFSADDHANSLNQAALCQSTQVVSKFVHFKARWSMVMAETDAGLVGKVKNEVRLLKKKSKARLVELCWL